MSEEQTSRASRHARRRDEYERGARRDRSIARADSSSDRSRLMRVDEHEREFRIDKREKRVTIDTKRRQCELGDVGRRARRERTGPSRARADESHKRGAGPDTSEDENPVDQPASVKVVCISSSGHGSSAANGGQALRWRVEHKACAANRTRLADDVRTKPQSGSKRQIAATE